MQQIKNKEAVRKWKEWSQGSSFRFNEGAIIYDRDVSSLETWGDKLDAIDFYIVLGEIQPVSFRASTASEVSADEDPGGVQRHPGSVNLKVFLISNKAPQT